LGADGTDWRGVIVREGRLVLRGPHSIGKRHVEELYTRTWCQRHSLTARALDVVWGFGDGVGFVAACSEPAPQRIFTQMRESMLLEGCRVGDLLLEYKYRADAPANLLVVKSLLGKESEFRQRSVALQTLSKLQPAQRMLRARV